ncbi:hypothetical protein RDI58_017142 [Solanum bulbocastanum]|uniref:GDU1 n=1 Tax=Solanum bulbocastanum TaxID=147425 RepID=A0AAN8YBP7_SOLBU
MTNLEASSSAISPVGPPRSPWHSPVPYLFGGLAAMLGLIAFALLILACSYWKLSGNLEENQEGDLEEGNNNNNNSNGEDGKMVEPPILEEKFLVIMAGQLKPTFIATPSLSSRASSFGSNSGCTVSSESSTDKSEAEEKEEEVNVSGSSLENHEETLVGEREKEEEGNKVSSSTSKNDFVVNVTQMKIN